MIGFLDAGMRTLRMLTKSKEDLRGLAGNNCESVRFFRLCYKLKLDKD